MTETGSTDTDTDTDISEEIVAAIIETRARKRPVYINAGGTKRALAGRHCDARLLDVSGHRGIIDYQPAELVITARAGTLLTEIVSALAAKDQMLAFEPPLFEGRATLGGTLACNLSGPARPWCGSIRDAVLGVQLINGTGELLNFGGRVMKNVAGYDVSRLQSGALGTLGVLSEVSLKVMPRPEHGLSLAYDMTAQQAIDTMNRRAGEPKPLSGAYWVNGRLHLRLDGAASAVDHTARLWGGETLSRDDPGWHDLREMSLPFFGGDEPLWRLSLKANAPANPALGDTLIDWGGAQRWARGELDVASLQATASAAGGHVTLFRGGDRGSEVRQPLNPIEKRLQQNLKHAFDPDGILNPGRLYSWL